ncbi:MAG: hypothetical protein R3E66_12430 [bacterium]
MKKLALLLVVCGCQQTDSPPAPAPDKQTANVAPVVASPVVAKPTSDVPKEAAPAPTPETPNFAKVDAWQSLTTIPPDFKMELSVDVVEHPQLGMLKSYKFRLDHRLLATASNPTGNSKSELKIGKSTALATIGRLADIAFPDRALVGDELACKMHEARIHYRLRVTLAGHHARWTSCPVAGWRFLASLSLCGTSTARRLIWCGLTP